MLVPVSLNEGISPAQARDLLVYSQEDPTVARFTSDRRRFSSEEAFREWCRKGRIVYTLSDLTLETLRGIVWFGEESLPRRDFIADIDVSRFGITTAFRLYGGTRGQGLADAVLRAIFGEFFCSPSYAGIPNKGIWFETSGDNEPVKRAYSRLGFIRVTEPNESGKILMVEGEPNLLKGRILAGVLTSGVC